MWVSVSVNGNASKCIRQIVCLGEIAPECACVRASVSGCLQREMREREREREKNKRKKVFSQFPVVRNIQMNFSPFVSFVPSLPFVLQRKSKKVPFCSNEAISALKKPPFKISQKKISAIFAFLSTFLCLSKQPGLVELERVSYHQKF